MTHEESRSQREETLKLFKIWCAKHKRAADAESLVEWDEKNGKQLLDYEAAKEDGYYAHLKMQANNWLNSCRITISTPQGETTIPPAYRGKNGSRMFIEDIQDSPEDLKFLISSFEQFVENKIKRIYFFKRTTGVRKQVQSALSGAEERAFTQTKKLQKATSRVLDHGRIENHHADV